MSIRFPDPTHEIYRDYNEADTPPSSDPVSVWKSAPVEYMEDYRDAVTADELLEVEKMIERDYSF